MKVVVDQDKCIGCGACVAISPDNFDFNEDGLSKVIGEEITDSTRDALEACPVYAIEINEESINTEATEEAACCCEDCASSECEGEENHDCECGGDCPCAKKEKEETEVQENTNEMEDE